MNPENRKSDAHQALEKIKDAEEKARMIIEEARGKAAAEILRKGYEEAEALKKKIVAAAKSDAEKRKIEIIDSARKEAQRIKKEAEDEKSEMLRKAGETLPSAVDDAAHNLKILLEGGSG